MFSSFAELWREIQIAVEEIALTRILACQFKDFFSSFDAAAFT